MPTLAAVCALAFYAAAAVLAAGLVHKVVQYSRTPAPLKIPTTPAPVTRTGVAARIAREVVLFESLFKASKWTWLFGWVFHAALLVVLVGHLRYFTEPVWAPAALVQGVAPYAGLAMIAGLAGLWARRLLVDRVRYISGPSDHLMLALLVAIGASGLAMRFAVHADVVALKAFALGLVYFDWQPIPSDGVLLLHLGLVVALMVVFPFSKLLHAPGLFFSPTRNQADDPRERRHVTPWAARTGPRRDGAS